MLHTSGRRPASLSPEGHVDTHVADARPALRTPSGGAAVMVLVRIIDLVVRMIKFLATPEARFLRAGLLTALVCGALLGAAALIWVLAQLPALFAGPGPAGQ